MIKTMNGPGLGGVHPEDAVVRMKNSSGGAVSAFDLVQLAFTSGTSIPGGDKDGLNGGGFTEFTGLGAEAVTGNGVRTRSCGIFAVAQEDIAAGETGRVMLWGYTQVKSQGNGFKGVSYIPDASLARVTVATGQTNFKAIALGTADVTLSASVTTIPVLFDGYHGFGQDVGTNSIS
jgi:hypothetical protein